MERKKIYRSSSDYMIAGVCGGIADYFEIEVTIVRLVMLVLVLGGGGGILIYLVLMLVMPKEGEKMKNKKEKAEVLEELKEDKSEIRGSRGRWLGMILIGFGIMALWNQVMPFQIRSEVVWPVLLMGMGLWIILK